MRKEPPNHYRPWTPEEDRRLRELAHGNTPTRVIGIKLGRTPESIYTRASTRRVSLRPHNRSPYGSRTTRRG
jgi:hypothetical protein